MSFLWYNITVEMVVIKLQKYIDYLKKSPIFSMSLGSKELFYSNFRAWIFEQKQGREFIRVFFPNINIQEITDIKREHKSRDIVIFLKNGDEYVIENKIKSYGDYHQLERYSSYDKFKEDVLTGIKEPPFELPKYWRFVSYKQIADGIGYLKDNFDTQYMKTLLTDYEKN